MLEYKGYVGEVVYDDEAGVLHARVINSGSYPIANAEVPDAEGIRREFRISIDEYLASCEELGIEAVDPFQEIFVSVWALSSTGGLRWQLWKPVWALTLGLNRPSRLQPREETSEGLEAGYGGRGSGCSYPGTLPLSTWKVLVRVARLKARFA